MVSRHRIIVAAFVSLSWAFLVDVLATESAAAAGDHSQNGTSTLIEKGNWPRTLAATRERYQATNAVMAVSGWYLCNEKFDSRSIHEAYPPETLHVAFDASRSIDGWKIVPRTEDGRFARYLSPGQTTYIYREFICARDDAHLESTFAVNAGHLAVWHNGEKAFAEESENTREPLQKTTTLRFRKGKNFLLVKMAAARGANFKFSTNGTAINQLKKALMEHYGREAFLLSKSGYFKEHQQWLFEEGTGDLLQQAATALLSSLHGFSELERELTALSDKSPDAHAAEWIGLYTTVASLRRDFDLARSQWGMTADTKALRRALLDLDTTFSGEYPGARYLEQLAAFESELPDILSGIMRREKAALDRYRAYLAFRRTALLANPLIDFEDLLLVRRVEGIYTGLPNNYIGNTGITYDLDDTIVTTAIRDPSPVFNTAYKPARNVFCGDIDLHFDAERILFSSLDTYGQWQVYELALDESELRQVTHEPGDVGCYDPIYLPDVPPDEHAKYVENLSPELASTIYADPKHLEEWQDDRFGVFMHWDPSCQMTGAVSWSRMGRRPHHPSDGTVTRGIPAETYDNLYKTFNPVKFDADAFVKMIKDAGARYFVFTAKHHQGFCMFDSAVTEYDIMSTPFGRDICKELADACHRHKVKLFWYYSQPDWHEPRYAAAVDSPEFARYRDEYLHPQLLELYTNYGRIDGIWWDGLGKHPDMWDTPGLLKKLREIQPHLVSNHRCGPRHWRFGDFDGPEGQIGRFQVNRPWETCTKIGGGWGYSGDSKPHNLANAVGLLVRCAGNGGNLLLNTGPAPDGTINPRHVERYLQMGAWLKQYGESIYATRGGPYTPGPWGCATRSKSGHAVYLHVLGTWNGILTLPNLPAKVISSRVLTGGSANVTQEDGKLTVVLGNDNKNSRPADIVHEFDTIVALELDKPAMEIPVIPSVGESLTVGAAATASSQASDATPASAVVAPDATEFHEGTFIRSVWSPSSTDEAPWLQIAFDQPKPIRQIQIQEGRYGADSTIEAFTIGLRVAEHGRWETVYTGTGIGNTFGLVLEEMHVADAMRIEFARWQRRININMVNTY